jgi:hypothetical protein
VLITVLATELGLLQRLLGTVGLTFDQWVLCVVVGMSLLVIAEIRKRVWSIPVDEVPKSADGADGAAKKPAAS